jgi:hypothetical protein
MQEDKSSFGKKGKGKIGVQRMSRWTFWRAGWGERKPLICSKCGKKVYKLKIKKIGEELCEECS